MKPALLLVLLVTLTLQPTFGQQRNTHQVFWFRLALADTINSKLKWELYLQRRTQGDGQPNTPIFNSPQFKSYWFWLNYSLTKSVKLSVSPFGYFESYVLNTEPSDAALPPIKEFRWVARLEHETKGNYFNYSNRYALEYRWRDLNHDGIYQPNFRVRYMVRLDKPERGLFSKNRPVTFTLSNEIFIQFGTAVKNNPNIFDQNRLYAGAAYEIFRNIKLSVGYSYWFQERNSGNEFDTVNTYWTVLTFDHLFSQFRKDAFEHRQQQN